MKRTICKQCGLYLEPGTSAELYFEDDKRDDINSCIIKCAKCNTTKRFVVNPNYKLWLDDRDSVYEVIKPSE